MICLCCKKERKQYAKGLCRYCYEKAWRKNNPKQSRESRRKSCRKYRENHLERARELGRNNSKRYYETNPGKAYENLKRYCEKYPEKVRKSNANYVRKRRKRDAVFRLVANMRTAITTSLRGNKKGRHWEALVGYTFEALVLHLKELLLPGMSISNYGRWHIDHKKPISAFNFTSPEDEEFKQCWALENLQPLWEKDNLRKSNKIM